MRVFLTGFMGSGKSTVGPLIAKQLQIPFIDADQFLENKEGNTIVNIFQSKGEAYFRKIETDCLKEIIQGEPCVVATGGGLIEKEENCVAMKQSGIVIYLKATAENILKMTSSSTDRPLLKVSNPLGFIQEKLAYRDPLYQKWSHFTVAAHLESPQQIASKIIDYLKT